MSIYPRTTFADVAVAGRLFVVSRPYKRTDRTTGSLWVVEFRDPLSDQPKKRTFPNERDAWAFYNRVTDDRAGLRCGSLTRRQVLVGAGGLTTIDEALNEYVKHRRARGLTESNTKALEQTTRRFLASTKWRIVKDITSGPLETWLSTFKGATARKYLSDIRAWVAWLLATDRLPEDPLRHVTLPALSEPMKKRALTEDEFHRLITCDRIRPHRRLWYWLGGRLGLRHLEISRLRWAHIDFATATLRMPAALTKSRRDAILPIPSPLMAHLKGIRQAPALHVCRISCKPCEKTWRDDLSYAGIQFETEHGRAVPSSLRKTFCTHLARRGVDIRTAQKLMRHADINLTANIYTQTLPSELREAAEKLG